MVALGLECATVGIEITEFKITVTKLSLGGIDFILKLSNIAEGYIVTTAEGLVVILFFAVQDSKTMLKLSKLVLEVIIVLLVPSEITNF